MKYEIRINIETKDGRIFNKSELADEVELTTRGGLEAIKYIKPGKKRYTWIEIPNDFQINKYYNHLEIVISEATIGKNLYKIIK